MRKHDVTQLVGQRILVVEDDAIISLDLESVLAAAGAEVVGPAATVRRALELSDALGLTGAIVDLQLQRESAGPVVDNLRRRGIPLFFTLARRISTRRSHGPGSPS